MIIIAVMAAVYFYHEREQITVSDLLAGGCTFTCDCLVTLIDNEAQLESMASDLRQVLESTKFWQGREVIGIHRWIAPP